MQLPKTNIELIEKIIMDTYFLDPNNYEVFTWEDFLALLNKINSNKVYSTIIKEANINEDDFFFLLKKIGIQIKLHQKTGIKYAGGKFSKN